MLGIFKKKDDPKSPARKKLDCAVEDQDKAAEVLKKALEKLDEKTRVFRVSEDALREITGGPKDL